MSKDAYQPCPCGSGKKIKFCCKDYAGEIDKIATLIDAEQTHAALELIERSLKTKPNLQCLHAFKLQLAIGDPNREKAKAAIDGFLKIAPTNPTALAAQAIRLAAEWDIPEGEPSAHETCRAAVATLQRALSNRGKYVTVLMMSAVSIVGRRLFSDGKEFAAAAHFHLAAMFALNLNRPANDILETMASPDVSLLVKNRLGLPDAPNDVPWVNEYRAAQVMVANGCWADAVSAIEGLAKTALGEPLPRRALGLLRAYLGETKKATELMRRYAAMDNVPEADAIDAEALAQYMDESQRPKISSVEIRIEIDDIPTVHEKLLSYPNATSLVGRLRHVADDDGVPPIDVIELRDRAYPDSDTPLTHENVPRELTTLHVFGKQTDRAGRIEYYCDTRNQAAIHCILEELLGKSALEKSETVDSEEYPAGISLVEEVSSYPTGAPIQQRTQIESDANRHALLSVWPDRPNAALDGKTPREVAQDPSLKIRLNAALMVLAAEQFVGLEREHFEQLRTELGWERTNAIVCRPGAIRRIPLVELVRVDCTRLGDSDLAAGFQYATAHAALEASRNFGNEIIQRPNASDDVRAKVNFNLFHVTTDSDKALDFLHEAQRLVRDTGQSPALMLIHELRIRAIRHETEKFNEVFVRLSKRHINEPGIREQLINMMVQLGIMRPDGSPVQREPVTVGAAAGEGNIWTPDGDAGASEESKLWIPSDQS